MPRSRRALPVPPAGAVGVGVLDAREPCFPRIAPFSRRAPHLSVAARTPAYGPSNALSPLLDPRPARATFSSTVLTTTHPAQGEPATKPARLAAPAVARAPLGGRTPVVPRRASLHALLVLEAPRTLLRPADRRAAASHPGIKPALRPWHALCTGCALHRPPRVPSGRGAPGHAAARSRRGGFGPAGPSV